MAWHSLSHSSDYTIGLMHYSTWGGRTDGDVGFDVGVG